MTCYTVILALQWWPGNEPTVSPKCLYMETCLINFCGKQLNSEIVISHGKSIKILENSLKILVSQIFTTHQYHVLCYSRQWVAITAFYVVVVFHSPHTS